MKKNRALSLLLVLSLLLTFSWSDGIPAYAASTPGSYIFDISEGNITVSAGGNTNTLKIVYGASQTVLNNIDSAQQIEIIGTTVGNKIAIDSVAANIIFNAVNIQLAANNACAFELKGSANVALTLKTGTTNILKSGKFVAGLQVPEGTTVSVHGTGTLNATGGSNAAGIGSGNDNSGGTINISSGTVTAAGGIEGAGIGCGLSNTSDKSGGTINISGGTVTANGGTDGAGIGGGGQGSPGGQLSYIVYTGSGGFITISGGTVTATAGDTAAGIGGGKLGAGGTIKLLGGTIISRGGDNNNWGGSAGIGDGGNTTASTVTINSGTTISAVSCGFKPAISGTVSSTATILMANFVVRQTDNAVTVNTSPAATFAPTYQSVALTVPLGTYQLNVNGILQEHDSDRSKNFTVSGNGLTTFNNVAGPGYYTVSYNLNGGSGDVPTQEAYESGSTVTVASDYGLTRDGYTLYGWNNGSTTYQAGSGYFIMGSASFTLTAVWKANKPAAPTLASKTDTTVTLTAVSGQEYSIDNGSHWQTGNTFTGLTGGVTYNNMLSRVAASGGNLASDASSTLSVTTKTSAAAAPAAPTLTGKTDTSIAVMVVAENEYQLDGGTWQDGNIFPGLTAGSTHSICTRVKETGSAMASNTSTALTVTTKTAAAAPAAPTLTSKTDTSITVTAVAGNEYQLDGGAWQDGNTFTDLTAGSTHSICTRVKETESALASNTSTALTVTTKTAAADAPGTPTLVSKKDTSITVTAVAGNEYQLDGGTWQDGNTFTDLTAGSTHSICTRVKETESALASNTSAVLTVITKISGALPATPTVIAQNNNSITINTAAGNQYAITTSAAEPTVWNTAETINGTRVFSGLTASAKYYIWVRTAETEAAMSSGASSVGTYTASAVPSFGEGYAINYETETISITNGYEVSDASDFGSKLTNGASIIPGKTYYVRKAMDTATTPVTPASAYVSFTAEARPAAPSVSGNDSVISYNYKDEKIVFGAAYEVYTDTDESGSGVISDSTAITPGGTLYIRVKSTSATPQSIWAPFSIPQRPETTGLSTSASKTDTAITVAAVTGAEYSKDGGIAWQSSNRFTGLNANTDYSITMRYVATDHSFASAALTSVAVRTKASEGMASGDVSVIAQSDTSITISTDIGYQYAITAADAASVSAWTDEVTSGEKITFTALTDSLENLFPATQYKIWKRAAETGTSMPSKASSVSTYTAAVAPSISEVTMDYAAETITYNETLEIGESSEANSPILSGTASDGKQVIDISDLIPEYGETKTIFIRVKESNPVPASAWQSISIPARPKMPAVTASDVSGDSKDNGSIKDLTTAMEWKTFGGTYAVITADQASNGITGLNDGIYYVRYAAVTANGSEKFASAAQKVPIGVTNQITGFVLGDAIKIQVVPYDTEFSKLNLPGKLKVVADEISDFWVNVTKWVCNVTYNPTVSGVYSFTPVLDSGYRDSGYVLDSGFKLPEIKVTVKEKPGSNNHSNHNDSPSSPSTAKQGTETKVDKTNNTATVTTKPDSVTNSGTTADIQVTVPSVIIDNTLTSTNGNTVDTAKKTAVTINLPTEDIKQQLAAKSNVELTLTVPSGVAKDTNENLAVTINANKEILEAAKAALSDVTIKIKDADTQQLAYSWTFRGADLAKSTTQMTDVNIAMSVHLTTEVPKVHVLTPSNKGLVLSFDHSGVLPSVASVRFSALEKGFKPGQTLYFYHYNPTTKQIESLGKDAYTVDADGNVTVQIYHCSDYVLLPKAARSITLDTRTYTMLPKKTYEIGVKLTNSPDTTIKAYSSTKGVANVTVLKNGNVKATGVKPGLTYIMIDVYDKKNQFLTHASVRVTVQNGVKPNGNSARQYGIF
jgi:hypothetical protein